MSDGGPLPPASGLARSLRRLFDENGGDGAFRGAAPRTKPAAVVRRERFTNRLARYLRGDPNERARLREAIRGDITLFLEANEPGPLADAVLALSAASRGEDPAGSSGGGVEAADPLLPALLAAEVLAELEARGDTEAKSGVGPRAGNGVGEDGRARREPRSEPNGAGATEA